MSEKRLLRVRKIIKGKKPTFVAYESWRYKRIKKRWRAPKGIDNIVRRKRKGVPKSPSTGYCSPKKVRGLHPSGFEEVLVYNVRDLDNIDPERQAIRIASTVGRRKAIDIMDQAESKSIWLLNPRVILAEEEELEELEEGETLREEDLEGLELEESASEKTKKGKKETEEGLTAGETELTAIKGIDKEIVKKLKEIGIFSVEDLAQETEINELAEIIKIPAKQVKELVDKAKEIVSKKDEEKKKAE
ncbi:MAG: 50S ribosomal protein L32e [Candidatus Jordarchaeaceae archaeon]